MTRNNRRLDSENWPFAVLSISWLLEDRAALSCGVRGKLAGPPEALIQALASLTPPERAELKRDVMEAAAHGSLPGPLRAMELCNFLDSIAEIPARRVNGSIDAFSRSGRRDSPGFPSRRNLRPVCAANAPG